jgi:hypothetical protein
VEDESEKKVRSDQREDISCSDGNHSDVDSSPKKSGNEPWAILDAWRANGFEAESLINRTAPDAYGQPVKREEI